MPTVFVYIALTPSWNQEVFVRLNIDFPAYIAATKYLLDIPLNKFSADMANHILFQAQRWGLPLIASFIKNTLTLNIYETLFSIIFIIYISSILFLKDLFGYAIAKFNSSKKQQAIERYKFLFFLCLLLNSPILFFTAEGFYPQIISISLISVVLAIFFLHRESVIKSSIHIFIITTLLFFTLPQTYSQAIFIYLPVFLMVFLIDLLVKKEKLKSDLFFLATICVSLLIDSKIFVKMISDHLNSNFLNVGYPQPNWLFPSEIIGFGSIYANSKSFFSDSVSTLLVHRSYINLFFSTILSSGFIYLYFNFKKQQSGLLLSVFIFILSVFSIDFYLSQIGKVQFGFAFNKIAVHFSAFFLMIVFLSLVSHSYKKYFKISKILVYAISISIVLTGILTLFDLKKFQSNFNFLSLINLNSNLANCNCVLLPNQRGMRYGKIVGQLRYVDRTKEALIMEPINIDVIDQWAPIIVNVQNENKRIFLMIFKGNQIKSNSYDRSLFQLVFENDNFLILDTNKKMKFFYGKEQVDIFKWVNSIFESYNLSSN